MTSQGDLKSRVAKQTEQQQGNGGGQRQPSPEEMLVQRIEKQKPEIARALPRHMTADRMARIATTLLRKTPDLRKCTTASVLGALMTCSQLGLEPGPLGHAWIIPRWNKKTSTLEAQFQLGYKGVIELARRSRQLAKINAHTVYSNEVDQGRFTVRYGSDERIDHDPIIFGDRGDPLGYYMIAKLTSGEEVLTVLSRDDVEWYRARSQTPNAGPWVTDYEAMAQKTCVLRGQRFLPQSPELVQALGQDGTTRTDISPDALDTPATIPGEIVPDDQPDQPDQGEQNAAGQTAEDQAAAGQPEPSGQDQAEPEPESPGADTTSGGQDGLTGWPEHDESKDAGMLADPTGSSDTSSKGKGRH